VALSASVLEEDRTLAFDAGMDGFVAKPIERPILLAEMARVLGISAVEVPLAQQAGARPVFDRAGALLRWDDDWVVLADMLAKFFRQNRGLAGQLDRLIATGENEAALDLAHKIKGWAGNIGLTDLFGALAALEGLLYRKSGDPDAALQAVALAVDAAWRVVEPELVTAAKGPAAGQQGKLDTAVLAAALTGLQKAVKRGALDDDALTVIVEMLPAQETQALRQALEDFDFSAADSLIEGMRKTATHVG